MTERPTLNEFVDSEKNSKESDGNSVQEVEESVQEMFGIGQIPREWDIQPLANLAEVIAGNSPPSSTYNEDENGLPFFQGNSEFGHFHPEADTWCSEPRKIAETDDILISIRAPVGELNIADQRCCIGRGLTALRQKNTSGLYLYYHLAERKSWLSRLATGSTFKSITKGDLQNLDIPRPPLSEQRKIATVLHTVDQAIQKTEEIIGQIRMVKTGIQQELFTEGYYDHNSFVETRAGILPESWRLEKVKNYTELVSGAHVKSDLVSNDSSHTPYLTGPDDFDELGFTVTKYTDEPTKFCEAGDTLVTVKGSGCGKSTFANQRACISRQLKALRPNDGLEELYLFYFVETKQKLLENLAEGSAIPGLSNSHLTALDIPVPSPEEQRRISETLKEYDDRIVHEKRCKSQLLRFKQGLMQDLLSGEVRTTDADIDIPEEVAKYG